MSRGPADCEHSGPGPGRIPLRLRQLTPPTVPHDAGCNPTLRGLGPLSEDLLMTDALTSEDKRRGTSVADQLIAQGYLEGYPEGHREGPSEKEERPLFSEPSSGYRGRESRARSADDAAGGAGERSHTSVDEVFRSVTERFIEEGRAKGRLAGRHAAGVEMLLEELGRKFGDLDPATRGRIAGASSREVDCWRAQLPGADYIDSVFYDYRGDPTSDDASQWAHQMMTKIAAALTDCGHRDGRLQGRREGKVQLVVRQLTSKFGGLDGVKIGRLAAATSQELDLWADRLLTADRIEDVFQG